MKEREQNIDPYWQIDQAVGDAPIRGEEYTIRLRVHTSKERYAEKQEIVPLAHHKGERIYFHARPYILVPDIRITIGAYGQPEGSKIGDVLSSEWEGMRHQEIGNAQAWSYPSDRLLIIWEAYLFDHYREPNPTEDEALKTIWIGFETLLLEHARGAERIATPAWEPLYEEGALWQDFLCSQGYRPFNERAFNKEMTSV